MVKVILSFQSVWCQNIKISQSTAIIYLVFFFFSKGRHTKPPWFGFLYSWATNSIMKIIFSKIFFWTNNQVLFLISFSIGVIKYSDTVKQSNRERVYFCSRFETLVDHSKEVMVAGTWSNWPISIRKQKTENINAQIPFFILYIPGSFTQGMDSP